MRRTAGFLWVTVLLLTSIAHAQEDRGTILGRITDPTGAALVGAAISVENVETGVKTASTTNDQGSYLIPYLPAGRYRVTVENPGFKRAEFFNTFNKVNLGNPGTTLGTPNFGRIASAGAARSVQLALKYGF